MPSPHTSPREIQGVALIATLALIVIASIMLVTFVTMMRLDRSASFSYSQSIKAEQIGLGGLQVILSQLQNEMAKDALPDTGNGAYPLKPVYSNVTTVNILPQRVGTNAAMPCLVKISTNAPFYTGSLGQSPLKATTIRSTAASQNGRSISSTRWSSTYLGTFPSDNAAPYWVMTMRSGPGDVSSLGFGTSTANSLNNPASDNSNYVVGRFAYAIYDEGGLLDITVAGYPSSFSSASQIQVLKGTLAGADLNGALSTLGIDADALVKWRNAVSAISTESYSAYATNYLSTNFLGAVYPGDTTFLSRQDLIKAAKGGTAGLSTSVLTNLTTFTRESRTPAWTPRTPTGSSIDYAAQANSTSSTNRFIPLVRSSLANASHYGIADNGSTYSDPIEAGDPIVRRRFSLAKLAWLTYKGPSALLSSSDPLYNSGGTEDNIRVYFGLKWQSSGESATSGAKVWQYVDPTSSTPLTSIATLNDIANEPVKREPNFFELLQAGILSGSVGIPNETTITTANSAVNGPQLSSTLQILRIGASIIDQYDADSYPTVIEYTQSGATWQAVGVESLPYLNVFKTLECPSPDLDPNAAVYLLFGLWNPTRAINTNISRPQVRLHVQGSFNLGVKWAKYYATDTVYPTGYPAPSQCTYTLLNNYSYPGYKLQSFNTTLILSTNSSTSGANGFSEPGLITQNDIATPVNSGSFAGMTWALTPSGGNTGVANAYVAFRAPDLLRASSKAVSISPNGTTTSITAGNGYDSNVQFGFSQNASAPFQYYLEYQNSSGNWIPYTYATGINDNATWAGISSGGTLYDCLLIAAPTNADLPTFSQLSDTFIQHPMYMTSDPRSIRFGSWQYQRNTTSSLSLTGPLWDSNAATNYRTAGYGGGLPSSGAANPIDATSYPTSRFGIYYHPAMLSRNNTDNASSAATKLNTSYVDKDNIRRLADSGLFSGDLTTGNPFQRAADRPIILNRPFQSVAELGYVFRDNPWRSLDLFSNTSADSALLDLFCLHDTPKAFTSGRISLNSPSPLALKAVLNNTIADAVGLTTMSNPIGVATDLAKFTATTPFASKAEFVTQFIGSASALTSSDFSGTDEQNIKSRREAAVRALSDVGQTGTWNLMIDIVAQAGKFPPTATGLDQFIVDAERRYWLHVAIDRFTGKIIDQKLEIVSE